MPSTSSPVAGERNDRKRFGLAKEERLLRRSEFDHALRRGRRHHTPHFTIVLCPNELDHSRLGLIVSKRIGNAVRRNRVKRLAREFFRLNKFEVPGSMDVVMIAKPGAHTLSYSGLVEEVVKVWA